MALAVAAAAVLLYPAVNENILQPFYSPNDMQIETTLKWDQYVAMCPRNQLQKTTTAEIQTKCTHLNGLRVHWEGTVVDVEVTAVHNPVDSVT